MTPYQEPSPSELEQIADEARRDTGKGPLKRTPAEGIDDMRARIAYHTDLLAKLRAQPPTEAVLAHIRESELQLAEARTRLTDYQWQADSIN